MSSVPLRSDELRRTGRFVGRFAHQLSVVADVPVGFRWNPCGSWSSGWQIVWSDGPSLALMRYHAAALVGSVAGVDVERLQWQRDLSVTTIALELIRNVSAGLKPLGKHASPESLLAELATADYPERGHPDREQARRLVALTDGLVPDMIRLLEAGGLYGLQTFDAGTPVRRFERAVHEVTEVA